MDLARLFNRSHRLALALWLALLLPLAQAAAARHEISHLGTAEQRQQGLDGHASACEACLAFAQVGAGAAPQLPAAPSAPDLSHACPCAHADLGQAAELPSQRNRGPPVFL
jgi:hypothetical protein